MDDMLINANPTKEFFISMLTRDIDLRAAIVELIDNSIDGAKRLRGDNFKGLFVKIDFNADYFCIEDNCGGISIDIAQYHAFRFGRSNREAEAGFFTGIFGIGMKRSLFRLGKYFEIYSKCPTESFDLKVDVNEWIKDTDPDWSFEFNEIKKDLDIPLNLCGTKIIVKELNQGISETFKMEYFANNLISYIEKYRTTAAEDGLDVLVNGKKITFVKEALIQSLDIKPFSKTEIIGKVSIKVIAGIAPKGRPENAGWYIYCNGRLIVYADKTSLTGWGEDGLKLYHPSLAVFRGFVFFESEELESLPWNTTKTNVDTSSTYYIAAKTIMKEATLQVIGMVNALSDIEDLDERDEAEKLVYNPSNSIALSTINIERISSQESKFSWNLPSKERLEKVTTITFKKPLKEVEEAKKLLGASSNKEVGEKVFDYYLARECEE